MRGDAGRPAARCQDKLLQGSGGGSGASTTPCHNARSLYIMSGDLVVMKHDSLQELVLANDDFIRHYCGFPDKGQLLMLRPSIMYTLCGYADFFRGFGTLVTTPFIEKDSRSCFGNVRSLVYIFKGEATKGKEHLHCSARRDIRRVEDNIKRSHEAWHPQRRERSERRYPAEERRRAGDEGGDAGGGQVLPWILPGLFLSAPPPFQRRTSLMQLMLYLV